VSSIITNLSVSPYWDDYSESKQFYKILFVPARAVQVREMNQLQTMIQTQISRFADHQFKDGSVVSGCNISYIPELHFIRVGVYNENTANTEFTTNRLKDYLLVSPSTNLRASILLARGGYLGLYPDTSVLYIRYLNKGLSGSTEVDTFFANEELHVYDERQDKHGNLNPGYRYNTINLINELPETPESKGIAYGVSVGDGIIYQKGYFVNVNPHTIVVKDYDRDVDEMMVGFETEETIISYFSDISLIDPVDTSNRSGIGADRLKLNPVLVAKNRNNIPKDSDFFPIIEFGKEQLPIKQNTDPEYNILGEEFAKRTFEESGDYYVKPFLTSTKSTTDTSKFAYTISPGTAYVKGNRVELNNPTEIIVPRATSTKFSNNNTTTINFGHYVRVKEIKGMPYDYAILTFNIYDQPATAFTSDRNANSTPPGNKVGELKVRQFITNSPFFGTPNGELRLYIFDIRMNNGKSFEKDAKCISTTHSLGFMGDLILENGKARIYDQGNKSLIFPAGPKGIKRFRDESGGNDNIYLKFEITSATLNSSGDATFTIANPAAGGTHSLFTSPGIVDNINKQRITIIPETAFSAGANNFKAKAPISHEKYTMEILSSSQFKISFGAITPSSNINLHAHYLIIRNNAVQIDKKILGSSYFVRLDLSSHPAGYNGPWCLGFTDILNIESVFVGNNFSISNPDRKSWFILDNGQKEDIRDLNFLIVKPEFKNNLNNTNKNIIVKFKLMENSFDTGTGFFTVDSYKVRNPGDPILPTNISYDDIPLVNGYQLRDCIDFRHTIKSTANKSITFPTSTLNPPSTRNFDASSINSNYLAIANMNFTADIENYMPRIDIIQVNKDGDFNVKSSLPSEILSVPRVDADSMIISQAFIPPFPGITADQNLQFDISKPRIKTNLAGNRGYTMKDIGSLDKRIGRLEYYQTLSMLEQSAKDFSVKDNNGLDRFKNGIFADPFNNHSLGDVSNFEYNVAIDERKGILRPKIIRNTVDLVVNPTSLNDVKIINSKFAILDYDVVLEISQPLASKIRNATESVWNWSGNLKIYPEFDHHKDETILPEVNIEVDNASPWEQFANTPFAQQFGDWDMQQTVDSQWLGIWTSFQARGDIFRDTTTDWGQRAVDTLSVDRTSTKYDLGSSLVDISISPWMNSRNIAFIANSLRPNTRFWVFFDGENVSSHCAPGVIDTTKYNASTGVLNISSGDEDQIIKRTANYGTSLKTDANGNLVGLFRIPSQTFKTGERNLYIADIDNLTIASDASTSSASAKFVASSISTTSRGQSITTIDPIISSVRTVETEIFNVEVVNRSILTWTRTGDPIAQSFKISVPASGLFVDSIGVYFSKKSPSLGITCYISEMIAGVPDSSRIIAQSYLSPSEVSISSNASAETIFKFNEIPYLTNDRFYAFFLKPDGDSPDYLVWLSEVGGQDIQSGMKIFSNPYIGSAFKSSNSESWDVLQTEDIKFNLYRCNFKTTSGSLTFNEENINKFQLTNVVMIGNNVIQPGDIVRTAINMSNNNPRLGVNDYRAIVKSYDPNSEILVLTDNQNKSLVIPGSLLFYRPTDTTPGDAALNSTNRIGKADLINVNNSIVNDYSIIVPQISTITPGGSNVISAFKGTNKTQIMDANSVSITHDIETEFLDGMRYVYPDFLVNDGERNMEIETTLKSPNSFISPLVDLRRKSILTIKNDINASAANEDTRYGDAKTKYISRIFNLAEDQAAEDILVLISAHIPSGTDIRVFGKFLSSNDPDEFYSKLWSRLFLSGDMIFASKYNRNEFKEYKFQLGNSQSYVGGAYKDNSDGVITYVNSDGVIFKGFRSFAIKIVLLSTDPSVVPLIDDVRGICLQA